MAHEIASTRSRPGLAEAAGRWRWDPFFSQRGGRPGSALGAERETPRTAAPLPLTFVDFSGGEPAGMTSLARRGPEERPNLGPGGTEPAAIR